MTTEYLTTDIDLKKVADGIRSRTGKTAPLAFPDGYVTEISTLTNTSADTVTADKLLEGVTAHDKSGKQITGTIGPLGYLGYNGTGISPGSQNNFLIPAVNSGDTGYVEGEGGQTVNVAVSRGTFGTATSDQVLKGKTFSSVEGIAQTGTYVPLDTSDATATSSDIAKGETAYVKGEKVTGTADQFLNPIMSYDNTMSYSSTSKKVTISSRTFSDYGNIFVEHDNRYPLMKLYVNADDFGNATAGEILNGKTCTSAAGLNIAGTMPNNGAAAIQLSDLTAKSVTAGYYSGGTAKVADTEAAKIIPENIKKGVTILGVAGTMEAGGDYNIATTTNADGTQNLAITDAAGGGSSGGSGQQLVNLTITVDPTNAPDEWSLHTYSTHGDEVVLDANNLVSTIPNCIVGGIFAIDASHSADPLTRKGYLDQDTIYPSCVNCLFSINIDASGFISAKDNYPVYLCQIAPDAPAGAEATITLKFN